MGTGIAANKEKRVYNSRLQVKVVVVHSLSYTGTTWINLVLGSHPCAFTLGPPDRVWKMRREGWDDACRVHGKDCSFWPLFYREYNPDENFYLQLAKFSKSNVIVINNPSVEHEKVELKHPDIDIKHIQLARDGKYVALSYSKHMKVDFFDAVVSYVRLELASFKFEQESEDVLALHYEKVLAKQRYFLNCFREFLLLDYKDDAFHFWKHDHHITSGNAGTISFLKFYQGIPVSNFRKKQFYEEQFKQLKTQPDQTFCDDQWKKELGRRELFIFDYFCGSANKRLGYDEDAFTTSERNEYCREIEHEIKPFKRFLHTLFFYIKNNVSSTIQNALSQLFNCQKRKLLIKIVILWSSSIVISWVLAYFIFTTLF